MEDEPQDMRYGLTAVEQHAEDSTTVWQIVSEITNFGVNNKQILLIIKRLALNLENRDHMRQIAKTVDEILENDPIESELVLSPE